MSETVTESTSATDEHAHEHPSDWFYIKIALILAFFTGIEVLTYFESALPFFENNALTITVLLVLMVVKFVMVAGFFMHLRFDNPLFTRLFVAGLALALAVYVAALSAFEFWA